MLNAPFGVQFELNNAAFTIFAYFTIFHASKRAPVGLMSRRSRTELLAGKSLLRLPVEYIVECSAIGPNKSYACAVS